MSDLRSKLRGELLPLLKMERAKKRGTRISQRWKDALWRMLQAEVFDSEEFPKNLLKAFIRRGWVTVLEPELATHTMLTSFGGWGGGTKTSWVGMYKLSPEGERIAREVWEI